ncbi:MAG TPA: hypothetical protein VES20_12645 [Bryobacteraceae bacterium]|nr:hypothetical protein [Bryobacteraceae bacterium]
MSPLLRIWTSIKRSILLIPDNQTPGKLIAAKVTAQRVALPQPQAQPQPAPAPPIVHQPPPPARPVLKGKLASTDRAGAAIRANPSISSAELASQLGVSSSYARRLLRKHREQPPATAGPVACPAPAPLAVQLTMEELHNRLSETERALQIMRSAPPALRGDWNLNRRSQVLRSHSTGMKPEQIASELKMPSGEVQFILKVASIAETV